MQNFTVALRRRGGGRGGGGADTPAPLVATKSRGLRRRGSRLLNAPLFLCILIPFLTFAASGALMKM
jgi:hypothetical protein